jgi:hypothetical protein
MMLPRKKKIDLTEQELLTAYRNVHSKKIIKAQHAFLRGARPAHALHEASLEDILATALHQGDKLALSTMKELNWLNEKGEVTLNCPVLKRSVQNAHDAQIAFHTKYGDYMNDPLLAHL